MSGLFINVVKKTKQRKSDRTLNLSASRRGLFINVNVVKNTTYLESVSAAASLACHALLNPPAGTLLTPHVNKSPSPLIGCGTKAPLL